MARITADFKVSEYAVFEAECMHQYGRVHENYVDNHYDRYVKERKVADNVHRFMVAVIEGQVPLRNALVV